MPLEALIFDVDGALADTEPVGRMRRPRRNPPNAAPLLYGAIRGGPLLRPTRCADLNGFLAQAQEIKSRRYVELTARREITPRPGVIRLLQEARAAHGATIDVPLLERLHHSWLERPTLH